LPLGRAVAVAAVAWAGVACNPADLSPATEHPATHRDDRLEVLLAEVNSRLQRIDRSLSGGSMEPAAAKKAPKLIIIAPPGGGKGTQSGLLSEHYGPCVSGWSHGAVCSLRHGATDAYMLSLVRCVGSQGWFTLPLVTCSVPQLRPVRKSARSRSDTWMPASCVRPQSATQCCTTAWPSLMWWVAATFWMAFRGRRPTRSSWSRKVRAVASPTPLARDGIACVCVCVRVRMRALIPGQLPDVIVVLEVPDEELVKRLSGRRFDPVTKRTYHVIFAPPSDPEVAARLTQRVDDSAEVAAGRIAKYRAALADCLAPFEGLAPTATVDGTGSVATVFERIRAVVDSCAT